MHIDVESTGKRFKLSFIVVSICVLLSMLASLWVWQLADNQEKHLIKLTAIAKSELIEHQFINSMPAIISALERMRNRWVAREGPPFEEWRLDAQDYVNDHAGLRAVEWVNSEYVVKWVVPLQGNESAVDLDLSFEKNRLKALERAKVSKNFSLSKPVQLVQGGKGFLAYFPIYIRGRFDGFILGVFDISQLVDSLLPHEFINDYNIEVLSEGSVMFSKVEAGMQYDESTGFSHSFALHGVNWELLLWPKQSRVSVDDSDIHYIALLNGLFVSFLAGIASFYLIKSRMSERIISAQDAEYKATLDNAIDGIITIDANGVIKSINNSAVRMFGYEKEESVGKNINFFMPEPYKSEHDQYLINYLTTGEKKIIGTGRQVKGLRKNGQIFPLDLGVTGFSVAGEQFFCGVVRDISKQVEMDQEREQLIERLTKSNEELDNFAYIASHDLKEPLRAIQNHAGFLKEDYETELGEDGVYKLDRLVYLGSKMEQLISNLMYFSRLGREEQSSKQVNMDEALSHVLERLKESLQEYNVEVLTEALPNVVGNQTRLEELLYNLITNGYKYNLSERKSIRVNYDLERHAFCVRDNGIGIDAHFKTEVFRIFKRLNSNKKFGEGTGSGLTFAKKIVEQHKGKIWFESELGKGTSFYFTLKESEVENE
ncbi:PAS domain S-box protein [Pseudoalteromonas luteoviolacea]|uniref:PAS domain S-box protein n=1 Tax=Pseudoalteromonas luteoviolacea TaxID=43657 RepID=UPI001B35C54A|nr:PAS domain S-box protein [Pseudoalteromonas luteoviolacea]MBQ4838993.1 PAS domain S-box protein [Pseudoalteromonas luteoviolacea]